jgi:hypothetical protein
MNTPATLRGSTIAHVEAVGTSPRTEASSSDRWYSQLERIVYFRRLCLVASRQGDSLTS